MRRSSLVARLVIVGLVLGALVLVPALACAGPAGPQGPAGPVGPTGPAVTGADVPSVTASPASVATATNGNVVLSSVTFNGAGWQKEKAGVIIELLLPDGTYWTLAGINIVNGGAFTIKPVAGNTKTKDEVPPGVYSVRISGKNSGLVCYVPLTITAAPTPTPTPTK